MALDSCLVEHGGGERFEPSQWAHLPDPFPEWRLAATEEDVAEEEVTAVESSH